MTTLISNTYFVRNKRSLIALAAISLISSANVYAQVDAGALQQGLEQQLPLPSPLALPEPGKAAPIQPAQPKEGELRFTVKSFAIEGVKILPEAEVQLAIRSWVGVPVSFDDLQRACDAIQNLYRSKGYTVQAILPPQKIADGVVKILVTEAKLGKVVVENPQGPTRFSKERAAEYITYANPQGDPLNMDNLERAIVILNETPGVMVSSQLEPGDKDGETNVRVQLTQPNLVQGRVEANNYGSRTTGANQGVFALNLNGPLGIGDSASVNGIFSEGSQYVQGAISVPGSENGLRLGLAGTYLQYKNVSNYASTGGAGDAWTTGVSAAYPLIRSQGANLNGSVNYDVKSYNNRNTISNTTISAYNINNISAGMSGNFVDGFGYGAVNSGSVTAILGHLDILGTSIANYSQYPVPGSNPLVYQLITPSNFSKLTFSGNRNQQLVEDGSTTLYTALSGQFASTNLNSAEQFYLGGPYGVRAYPVAQSGGSQGGLFTMEVRHELQPKVNVSAFFDAGVVQQYKFMYPGWQGLTNANNTYSLMGAGLGVKWDYEGWNLGAMVAWKVGQNPLYNSYGQPVNTDGTTTQPRGWITGSYNF
ncbi:ShlB/FhaC/HecB family hemolysin secretion/activation protein [Polynucleobacter sp. AP-Kolm-20A-A1]|uniref:ShlB/FhaC/HecB family hemolysin secretion/activation protein n=1 Tax=Polynucleobacter sp. AP-Kolm-20A-A1 TaxID=2081041 RepID=UPI001BFD2DFB|nr:ShlB/FhaC/HecB family hemolysin secretion/activation protein [Polynucleobacter sp. AP-Kolm-20A-A1]QWE19886.1 ShlB/FhaC/HecB family hemolysin secretion/activation protein [Polynucleobacter sp. AP-Kolm-20A-A1]